MTNRNDVVRVIVDDFYGGDLDRAVRETGYTKQQFQNWLADKNCPQKAILQWLIHRAFVPEFKVIVEYKPVDGSQRGLRKDLKDIIGEHANASGIYAFYDSMGNLAYVGKSNGNLLGEIYQQLNAKLRGKLLPRGAVQPERRRDVIRYISAYFVKGSDFEDYAKHVESLILRIGKPPMNANIGTLNPAVS